VPVILGENTSGPNTNTWHQRLGHIGFQNMKNMQVSDIVQGQYMKKTKVEDDLFCEGCIYKVSIPFRLTSASRIGGMIHSDLVGSMSIPSIQGSKYFMVFKTDYSCYSHIHAIKNKSEAADLWRS
jgi:hypothetical protein